MKKIVTITFSPTIDKSVSIKRLKPETKIKCSNLQVYTGGGGINIAKVLARFNVDVTALFPVNKSNFTFFKNALINEKVKHLIVESQNKTRENIEVYESFSGKQFRFVMPSDNLTIEEWNDCLIALEKIKNVDMIIVSGGLPENSPINIFKRIAEIAASKNAKLIVDTYGKSLKNAIQDPLFLIKPNLEEFGLLVGKKDLKINEVKKEAIAFLKQNKCEILVISLGKKGAMLFTVSEAYVVNAPKVKVKSTVGAGDSMLAGLVYGLSLDKSMEECLKYGIAFGTATTMQNGTTLCSKENVEHLIPKIMEQK